jgi:aerobic-type carbon monoxide dehydrogenase small subunit (CoxS/CutS family)
MITADEARKFVDNNKSEKAKAQIDQIESEIRKAMTDNKYECYIYEPIIKSVQRLFEENGFTIRSNTSRNETTVAISWRKNN